MAARLTLTLHLSLILPLTLPLPPNPKPNPKPDPNLSPSLTLTLTPTLTRWLRAERAAWVKGRLSEAETRSAGLLLVDFEPAYIRDVYVWLPDVRWGRDSMPCCPTCETAAHVGNHGFQSKHHARRCAPATAVYAANLFSVVQFSSATAFTQHIAPGLPLLLPASMIARRVLASNTHYFIMSRRYTCRHCEIEHRQVAP